MKRPTLTGKPHWPLTTYEKVWGFWHLAGIALTLGIGLILGPIAIFTILPVSLDHILGLFLGFLPIFGMIFLCIGLIGVTNWWDVIHGTIPEPAPWARIIAYSLNEPDPWKEQAELQSRLDKVKKGDT